MKKIIGFLKKETVLSIAWTLAIVTAIIIPPDGTYLQYIDFRTLGLLFCLMTVMSGFDTLGVFEQVGKKLVSKASNSHKLEAILVFLCFFSSMLITNDVALITFVPFAAVVLSMCGMEERLPFVVIFQTIAANMGSTLLPIGNPQNIYLYSKAGYTVFQFMLVMLPYVMVSFFMILACILFRKNETVLPIVYHEKRKNTGIGIWIYSVLFLFSLFAVFQWIPVWAAVIIVVATVFIYDRKCFLKVDYSLLLTFVGFFLFVGNMGKIPLFADTIHKIILGNEVIVSVAVSQVISNVPATLLLSGFTSEWDKLLMGVNLGGLGTMIASMASLISYKYIKELMPERQKQYFAGFTKWNVVFLAALLLLYYILTIILY